MRLGFDIDGVLAQVFPAMARAFVEVTGRDAFLPDDLPEPTKYNIHLARGYTMEEGRRVWDTVAQSDEWWFNLPAFPEVYGLSMHFDDLCDDHEVYFITARRGRQVKAQTEGWLSYNLAILRPTVLIVGHHEKGNVAKALSLDAYIEDNLDNAVDVIRRSPITRTFLVNRRYNQSLDSVWNDMTEWGIPERVRRSRVNSVREMLHRLNLIPYTDGVR
jgi:uncharacterized HAD superfamily protein